MPSIIPLPEVLRCAGARCVRALPRTMLLDSGWGLIDGRPYCDDCGDRIRLSVIFDTVNAVERDRMERFDPNQTQDMPAPEDDP